MGGRFRVRGRASPHPDPRQVGGRGCPDGGEALPIVPLAAADREALLDSVAALLAGLLDGSGSGGGPRLTLTRGRWAAGAVLDGGEALPIVPLAAADREALLDSVAALLAGLLAGLFRAWGRGSGRDSGPGAGPGGLRRLPSPPAQGHAEAEGQAQDCDHDDRQAELDPAAPEAEAWLAAGPAHLGLLGGNDLGVQQDGRRLRPAVGIAGLGPQGVGGHVPRPGWRGSPPQAIAPGARGPPPQ